MVFCVGHTKRTPDVNQSCCAVCMCRFAFSALTLYTLEQRVTQQPAGIQAPLLGPGFDYHLVTTLFSVLCCAIIYSLSLYTHTHKDLGMMRFSLSYVIFLRGNVRPSSIHLSFPSVYVPESSGLCVIKWRRNSPS